MEEKIKFITEGVEVFDLNIKSEKYTLNRPGKYKIKTKSGESYSLEIEENETATLEILENGFSLISQKHGKLQDFKK